MRRAPARRALLRCRLSLRNSGCRFSVAASQQFREQYFRRETMKLTLNVFPHSGHAFSTQGFVSLTEIQVGVGLHASVQNRLPFLPTNSLPQVGQTPTLSASLNLRLASLHWAPLNLCSAKAHSLEQ